MPARIEPDLDLHWPNFYGTYRIALSPVFMVVHLMVQFCRADQSCQ